MDMKKYFTLTLDRILTQGPGGFDTEIFVKEFSEALENDGIGYGDVESKLLEGIESKVANSSEEISSYYRNRISHFVIMAEGILEYRRWLERKESQKLDRVSGITSATTPSISQSS